MGWINCYLCKEPFMLHAETEATLRRSSATFHCPWGHPQAFKAREPEADVLRREVARLKQNAAYLESKRKDAEAKAEHQKRRANGFKGYAAKLGKRAKAGVCPCCNRTFQELARHMASQHPARILHHGRRNRPPPSTASRRRRR